MLVGKHMSHRARPRPCWLPCQPPFQHPQVTGSPCVQLPAWASCPAGPRRCLVDSPWRALAPPAGPDIQGFLGQLEGEDRSQ